MRLAPVFAVLAACSSTPAALDSGPRDDASSDARADTGARDATLEDGGAPDDASLSIDAPDDVPFETDAGVVALDAPPDAGRRVIGVRVLADAACSDLSFDPPSISVPAGSSFTVNWINATGCTEVDVDMNGTVPIVIGLEPGTSYHDMVREWCGAFTGTFYFRAYYAPSFPYYLDVDCSG
jgi:hypothetical protein